MTNKDVDWILKKMHLVVGRQFEHIFYVKHNVRCRPLIRPRGQELELMTVE